MQHAHLGNGGKASLAADVFLQSCSQIFGTIDTIQSMGLAQVVLHVQILLTGLFYQLLRRLDFLWNPLPNLLRRWLTRLSRKPLGKGADTRLLRLFQFTLLFGVITWILTGFPLNISPIISAVEHHVSVGFGGIDDFGQCSGHRRISLGQQVTLQNGGIEEGGFACLHLPDHGNAQMTPCLTRRREIVLQPIDQGLQIAELFGVQNDGLRPQIVQDECKVLHNRNFLI